MKYLYLIRHAKSSWKDLSLRDYDRPLNSRGKRDAPFMGQKLHELNFIPDYVISSPAKRAKLTAIEICNAISYPLNEIIWEQKIYGASCSCLLNIMTNINGDKKTVCIFGHNPTLTDFCNYLSGSDIYNIPTCGIAEISFDTDHWSNISKELGELKRFDYPKKHLT